MDDRASGDGQSRCPANCPHCGSLLKKWVTPAESSWGEGFQHICFNDECSYYVRGWKWMKEKYNVNASYRYRCDPKTGETGPLPVWSEEALKAQVVDA
jgi:hypothetical protein